MECAASGRAAITTKRPGCKETVVDGVTGYLVDEQNKEQVLEAAMKFIELPFSEKQIMGLNARKYMESHFDRNIVINAYHKAMPPRLLSPDNPQEVRLTFEVNRTALC